MNSLCIRYVTMLKLLIKADEIYRPCKTVAEIRNTYKIWPGTSVVNFSEHSNECCSSIKKREFS